MNFSPWHSPLQPNPDLHVDRTLHALNHVQPTPGLEKRLLLALEARGVAQPAPCGVPWTPKFLSIATAAVVLMAAAVFSLHLHRQQTFPHLNTSPLTVNVQPQPTFAGTSRPARVASSTLTPSAAGALSSPTISPSAKVGSLPPIHLEATLQPAAQPAPPHPTLDQQALDDFQARSQLAPPMPLTDQERMIALMLRHGEKHDLDQLETARETAFAQKERASYHSFFDPPPSDYLREQLKAAEKRYPSQAGSQAQSNDHSGDPQ